MSIGEVQARAEQLRAQFAALAVRPAVLPAVGPTGAAAVGTAAPAGEGAFAAALARASAPAAPGGTFGRSSSAVVDGAVSDALSQLGVPYVWGGEDPSGFDCSGLVQWAYGRHGVEVPRVSRDQAKAGIEVAPDDARKGDLLFFNEPVDHVGIYLGDGRMVVAPHRGAVVRVQQVDLDRCSAIRRVVPSSDTPGAGVTVPGQRVGAAPAASAAPVAAVAWAAGLPAAGRAYAPAIEQAASAAGVDPRLVAAVAWTESAFRPGAVSSAGAAGLMQLMPGTARGLGVADPHDPAQSLRGGARYLAEQLDRFGGRPDLALAAYNAGPTAVRRHGGIPPYAETRAYVTRVLARYDQLRGVA